MYERGARGKWTRTGNRLKAGHGEMRCGREQEGVKVRERH